jgi:hypothetical protein
MTPLDRFWTGVLDLLRPIITPDWGALVSLIPLGLALLVLGYLVWMGRRWAGVLLAEPGRGRRRSSLKPLVIAHFGVIIVGIVVAALAFVIGSSDPSWDGAQSPFGLKVNIPLLLLGVVLAVGSAGNGARLWERNGADASDASEAPEPDAVDQVNALIRAHPARARRLLMFSCGVLLAALGLIIKPAADATTGIQPVATLPLLLPGLVLVIAAFGSAFASLWSSDPDFDAPAPADN